ncbi:MAG: hypothetical protein E6K10_09980 [Methanobacteriota archaeon]|nr:MAG: hypothetical protein E6K10_09980 [Euryarchaeota archaeon]
MALRALTPSGAAYCSECGADTPPTGETCTACGRAFEGVLEAVRCPFCAAILFRNATECYRCGREVPPAEREASEESYFAKLMDNTRRGNRQPEPRTEAAGLPATGIADPALWKLSDSFQQVLQNRKKRIEQMDSLVARARRRVRMLESSNNPIEIREREELKRQIAEILVEREEIVKIEQGIGEMERIYRNILELQQTQLRDREESLKTRVEAFQKELERREQEKAEIKEREADLNRREAEFRGLLDRLHEREREADARDTRLSELVKNLEARTAQLESNEQGLRKQAAQVRGRSSEITIEAPDPETRDLQLRVTELEEQMEQITEEKNRIQQEHARLSALQDEVKAVLRFLDELLGKLPEEEVKKFAKSKEFEAYEKVLDAHGL